MTTVSAGSAQSYRTLLTSENVNRINQNAQAATPLAAPALLPSSIFSNGLSGSSSLEPKGSSVRQSLDAGYGTLGKLPSDTVTGEEWYKVVGFDNFSREELVDIMQNTSGEFTELEMNVAKMNLVDRQAAAMKAANPTGSDPAAAFRAAVAFLDEAGPNEMKTLDWAKERAAAQTGYEWVMQDDGLTPEDLNSGNAIVALFLKGYDELRRYGNIDSDVSDMPSYQEAVRQWHLRQEKNAAYSA